MRVALLGSFGQVVPLYSSDMLIGTKCLNMFSYFNNHCKTFVVGVGRNMTCRVF